MQHTHTNKVEIVTGIASLAEQMIESDLEFRSQFDRQNPSFHKGLQQPVPVGGFRVPQSMKTEYPENFNPVEIPKQQYGEEYLKIEKQRQFFLNLKKLLAKLSPIVEAIFRHNQHFREKADKKNEKHIEVHNANILKQEKQLEVIIKQLEEITDYLSTFGTTFKQTQKQLQIAIKDARQHYETKQALTDYGFRVKRISAKSFAQAQKLLESMKKIKKAYKPKVVEIVKQPVVATETEQKAKTLQSQPLQKKE